MICIIYLQGRIFLKIWQYSFTQKLFAWQKTGKKNHVFGLSKKWPKTYEGAELTQHKIVPIWTLHAQKPYHNFLFGHLDGFKVFNFLGSKIWVILPYFKRGLPPILGSKAQLPLYINSTYICLFLCSVVPNHMNYKCTIGDDATSITREELDITSDATLKWFRPGPDGSLIISDAGNSYTDTIVP